jgi:hypothetical protein
LVENSQRVIYGLTWERDAPKPSATKSDQIIIDHMARMLLVTSAPVAGYTVSLNPVTDGWNMMNCLGWLPT